jgi:polyphosphate kinase
VYRFANGGAPEYFIGSADLRPRNLRRRVELLVPVAEPTHRAQLDALLAHYLHDPNAWVLHADGHYRQSPTATSAAAQQAAFTTTSRELGSS